MMNINLDEIINKWIDMKLKTYDKLELGYSIYLYHEGEKYSEILIEKKFKNIFYDLKLYEEFYEIIPLKQDEFEGFISKWFGDTFGLKGFTPRHSIKRITFVLKIPK